MFSLLLSCSFFFSIVALDAGANATELFRTRGWTKIVMDDLVPNILMMTSVVIGGATGCFAHLIEHIDALHITSLDQPGAVSFW